MTINDLIGILNNTAADHWEITHTLKEGWEFYFIRHALDQNRFKRVETFHVKVYRKSSDGACLGSAAGNIPPQATAEETEDIISGLLMSASFVKNPVYTLNRPVEGLRPAAGSPSPEDLARDFLTAVTEIPETETGFLNSWELFTTRKTVRLVTSEGIDLTAQAPEAMLEAVINARSAEDGKEIELYRLYRNGGCDAADLKADITRAIAFGRDRLRAEKTPSLGRIDVVFSTSDACEIYRWFIDRMNAAFKHTGWVDWNPGQPISDHLDGDTFTVRAVTTLPHASDSLPFDAEGAPRRDLTLISRSVPVRFYGSRQFSQYLGLEDSFIPGSFSVDGGSLSREALRSGRYLEIVEFSDFQVDPLTGDIAGEIRLGYLYEDGICRKIVSGGSVSGNMRTFVQTMRATQDQKQYNNLMIPAETRLMRATVTGAA